MAPPLGALCSMVRLRSFRLPCDLKRCRWIQVQSYTRACPVCKAGVEVDKVIPIYGRGSEFDPRQEAKIVQPVPPRPAGQRPSPTPAGAPTAAQQQGVLPALFGFQLGPGARVCDDGKHDKRVVFGQT
jgi:hypothetical protein